MTIDTERITEAIISTGVSPLALEEGAQLVQHWIDDESGFEDEIIAVEVGFSIQIDSLTWVIGVQDLICADARGIYGREHKTTKEPSRWWNEKKWLESIKSGPQIAVYALALNRGVFYENGSPFVLGVTTPVREYVRAVVKSSTPQFWPTEKTDSWQEFDDLSLSQVVDAFRVKAEQIRASKRSGLLPWQLPGNHCTSFNRLCDYWDECTKGTFPANAYGFDQDDPAATHALPFLPEGAKDPDAVILSASSYSTYTQCLEKGRRNALSLKSEESMALDVGTVLHAGVASFYKQLREQQQLALTK